MPSNAIAIANPAAITAAVAVLRRGELVAMPTETVYGLAADATNSEAVARIYSVKGRPQFNPLIAHVADSNAAQREGILDKRAQALAASCWPGPLTLVVPVRPDGTVCDLARAGLNSIALRVPDHPVARELLAAVPFPLAAPSANRSGRLSPTSARDVATELQERLGLILDGGASAVGVESTIIAVLPEEPLRLLRPGALSAAMVEKLTGEPVLSPQPRESAPGSENRQAVVSPGQLASHYAPRAAVRLNAHSARAGEVLLGFGPQAPPDALNLSVTGDTTEAAANLYAMLRQLDALAVNTIAVMPIPAAGLGTAINDRLRRAAAPRG